MVQVLSITLMENCLDSSQVKEFKLDTPLNEELMRWMARDDKLLYYPDFPRPYFRIERKKAYVIQGVLDNDHFRSTFMPSAQKDEDLLLQQHIESM